MKNNTKIRLHLSKQLFEALTKQVLAEAKVNDGYSETVKQPKGGAVKEDAPKMPPAPASKSKAPSVPPLKPKMPPAPNSKPKVPPVPPLKSKMEEVGATSGGSASTSKLGADMIKAGQAMKTATGLSKQELEGIEKILNTIMTKAPEGETAIGLQKALAILQQNTKSVGAGQGKQQASTMPGKMEEMSSKEKMKKGLYKEDAGALQPGENVSWLDGSQREYKGVVQSQEEGDYYKVKITAAPAGGHKEGSMITKQLGDLKKAVAEGSLNEMGAEWEALLTAAGVAGAGITSYGIMKLQDLLQKKFPEQYKKAQKARSTMGGANPGLDV